MTQPIDAFDKDFIDPFDKDFEALEERQTPMEQRQTHLDSQRRAQQQTHVEQHLRELHALNEGIPDQQTSIESTQGAQKQRSSTEQGHHERTMGEDWMLARPDLPRQMHTPTNHRVVESNQGKPLSQQQQLPHQLERTGEHRRELTPSHYQKTSEMNYGCQRQPSQARQKLAQIRAQRGITSVNRDDQKQHGHEQGLDDDRQWGIDR